MQITGAMPVVPSEAWGGHCLTAAEDDVMEGFKRLGDAVRGEGGRMLGQLAHAGPTEYGGPDVVGPSRLVSEVTRQVVRPATTEDLERLIEQFAAAASRCVRGELDGVELSMAHGLLLASFLSPFTNHRDDDYGGSLERRASYPLKVLAAVRGVVGSDRILGVRLVGNELVDGGITPATVGEFASLLEPYVDYLNVTIGNNNQLEARVRHWAPTPASSESFRQAARAVKIAVSLPVGVAGRIVNLDDANEIILAGEADLVGMVRAHIADPELLEKARRGRRSQIRPCVGANVCINRLLDEKPIACLMNPDLAGQREEARRLAGQAAMVIGGGPAGLEAARRLALSGAAVDLFESQDHLGGQMADWALAPCRREVTNGIEWWGRELERLGVHVHLAATADATVVDAAGPDVLVVAAGAVPAPLQLPHVEDSMPVIDVVTALREGVGHRRAVVYDMLGDIDAMLVSERLATLGAEVTLVTSRLHPGEGAGITTLFPMLRRLGEIGICTIERARLRAISGDQVHFSGVFGQHVDSVCADVLVPWLGGQSRSAGVGDARARGHRPLVVGDALRPRRVDIAVRESARAIDRLRNSLSAEARQEMRVTSQRVWVPPM
jgi:2,4-dienoyl-CoA reductase-like NADH-dependent reductase (Old Yellow Enzyme family)